MHQLWEMLRPVCLLILTQFPNHPHQCLMDSFHLSIGLGVVWQSSHLPTIHELAQLTDDVALKGGSSVTQELGWCFKDYDVALPQKFSNSFCHLIRGHICHNVSCEVVTKDQNIHYMCGSVWFHCHLNASEIHMKQLQRRGDQNSF